MDDSANHGPMGHLPPQLAEELTRAISSAVHQEGGLNKLFAVGSALYGPAATETEGGYRRTPDHMRRRPQAGVPLFPSEREPAPPDELLPFNRIAVAACEVLRAGLPRNLPSDASLLKSRVAVHLQALWGPQGWHQDAFKGLRCGGGLVVQGGDASGSREVQFGGPAGSDLPPLPCSAHSAYLMGSGIRGALFFPFKKLCSLTKEEKEEWGRAQGGRAQGGTRHELIRELASSFGFEEVRHRGWHPTGPPCCGWLLDVFADPNHEPLRGGEQVDFTDDQLRLIQELNLDENKLREVITTVHRCNAWDARAAAELSQWSLRDRCTGVEQPLTFDFEEGRREGWMLKAKGVGEGGRGLVWSTLRRWSEWAWFWLRGGAAGAAKRVKEAKRLYDAERRASMSVEDREAMNKRDRERYARLPEKEKEAKRLKSKERYARLPEKEKEATRLKITARRSARTSARRSRL